MLQPLYTLVLFKRRVFELIPIALLALASGYTGQASSALIVGQDLLLGVVVAIILCPLFLNLCGFKDYRPYA